jgi:O-antigen ligase
MEALAPTPTTVLVPTLRTEWLPERCAAWLLAFAPTVYLALSGGGYDIVARSQVVILLWWVVLLGALIGLLPRRPLLRVAWLAVALLGGFLILTWIAVGWSSSAERTLIEAGRVSGYLGIFVLGLSLVSSRNARSMLNGLACAIALVSLLAVLSRLIPSWFPIDPTARFYATPRLRYPFDYSDGVGEFVALGLPLLLYVATGARSVIGRALGMAALPVVVLCLAMTVSRAGVLAAAVTLAFFYALVPDRLPRLLAGLIAAVGSAVVVAGLLHRPGLRDQLTGAAPAAQRHDEVLILILVCAGVGLVHGGITLLSRRVERPSWSRVSERGSTLVGAAIVGAVVIGLAVLIGTGAETRIWNDFKKPNASVSGTQYLRLLSIAGSHRYQYWQVAAHAFDAHPWKGIGPGTFQFYWAAHQTIGESVVNAHSLWMETLAELGIPGLALIAGLFAFVLVAGSARALSARGSSRLLIATATAGVAGFCAAAAFDWVWQIGAVPLVALLLMAVALGAREESEDAELSPARPRIWTRVLLVAVSIPALWAIARPLAVTNEVRASQSAAQRGDFRTALSDALTAHNAERGAASPWLQRALLLEQLGDVRGAAAAIAEAKTREPTNWQIWLVVSRIATENDQPGLALAAYRRARSLNPTSPIFK